MDRIEKRQAVITACIEQQQHIANVAKQEMDSAQQQSNDYGANVDRYDSYRTKMLRSRDMYARQYSNALSGIRYLQDLLRLPPFDTVEHGACVVTDRQRFLLSIGAGKFNVTSNGCVAGAPRPAEVWFAISAQTPIYAALKGKHVGDTIVFNGQQQTLKEIF
ncbi:MAG: hypothetical protein IK058_05500 [Bacteroidales bacterium]|nr:hypothetical protein [Bacteroidales bacterium]